MISRPHRAGSGRSSYYDIESLEPRRLLSAFLVQPISNVSFAQDSGPETVDLYALFADSNGTADLSFTVTSSVPSIVSSSILGNKLTLTPAAGRSGYSIIRMTAADPTGNHIVNQFRVQITALAARSLDVTLDSKHPSIQFTQSDHSSAKIALSGPGTAVVHFGGDGLKLAGSVLQGSRIEMESAMLSNTTGKTRLSITGTPSGSAQALIGNITVDKSLGSLDIHKATLFGDVQVAAALSNLAFDFAETGGISVGSGTTKLTIGTASDEVFISAGSVSSVKATQWLDTDNVPEEFAANALEGMSVRGNFMAAVTLKGTGIKGRTLNNVKVRGAVYGQWSVPGRTGTVEIGFTGPTWEGHFGAVDSMTFEGNLTRFLSAESIKNLKVRGQISFCTIELTGTQNDLGLMTVGSTDSFLLVSNGNIGTIVAPSLNNSLIWAGLGIDLSVGTLPTSASAFLSNARIGSIRLHPGRGIGFTGSVIAAERIGSLALVSTNSKNKGVKYGIVAGSIDSLSMQNVTHAQAIALRKVKTAAAMQAAIAAHKWVLDDLTLRIV